MRQLQIGSILYAGDNDDFLPKNGGAGIAPGTPNWVAGSFASLYFNPNPTPANDSPAGASTNSFFLGVLGDNDPGGSGVHLVGSIGSYVKMPEFIIVRRIIRWNRIPDKHACVPVRPIVTWETMPVALALIPLSPCSKNIPSFQRFRFGRCVCFFG